MGRSPLQEFAMIRVLLVDDDQELTGLLSEYLEREGFEATAVHTGEEGEVQALSGQFSIVVLDVMLPRLSGIEVLRRIRARSQVPVVLQVRWTKHWLVQQVEGQQALRGGGEAGVRQNTQHSQMHYQRERLHGQHINLLAVEGMYAVDHTASAV